jgi:hypothetical protein
VVNPTEVPFLMIAKTSGFLNPQDGHAPRKSFRIFSSPFGIADHAIRRQPGLATRRPMWGAFP